MKKVGYTILAVVLCTASCIEKESAALLVAKDMCACRFVVEQSEAHCRDSIGIVLSQADVNVDEERKEVTGKSKDGSAVATFRFASPQLGCSLKE